MKYKVEVEATATCRTTITVDAKDEEEARQTAKEECIGNGEWEWFFPNISDVIETKILK